MTETPNMTGVIESTDDLDFALDGSPVAVASIAVCVVAEREELVAILGKVSEVNPEIGTAVFKHGDDPSSFFANAGVLVFETRLIEGFDDLNIIRRMRAERPLIPIIVVSVNEDPEFALEAYRAGATNYLTGSTITPEILASQIAAFNKLAESARLIEIQNQEMVRSARSEREAVEKKAVAEAQAAANRQTREILDSLNEAFFVVEKALTIAETTSASCEKIFGHALGGKPLGDVLGLEGSKEDHVRAAFEQLFENILPLEVNVGLLPTRCGTKAGRVLDFSYVPIVDRAGEPQKVIVVAADVTEMVLRQLELEKKDGTNRTLIGILKNKNAFGDFLTDAKKDVEALSTSDDFALAKRILHTLKGNSAAFALTDIADAIHAMENRLLEIPADAYSAVQGQGFAAELAEFYMKFLTEHSEVIGLSWEEASVEVIPVTAPQFESIERIVAELPSPAKEELTRILAEIRLKPVAQLTTIYRGTVERLAQRGEKKIHYLETGMELRVDPMRFGALFKNLIHAIRNACDHGLETVEDRVDNGKREVGLLRVTIDSTPEKQLHVRVLDDGKGISLQKLSEKALREGLLDKGGLAKVLETDPFSLVFVDGLSSAEKVSDTSGRGTGMSCIKMEVERLGGVIKVTSKPQVGTRLDILVPQ